MIQKGTMTELSTNHGLKVMILGEQVALEVLRYLKLIHQAMKILS